VGTFFIIFPAMVLLVLLFISRQAVSGQSCRSTVARTPANSGFTAHRFPIQAPSAVLLGGVGAYCPRPSRESSIIRGQDWDRNPVAGDWGLFRIGTIIDIIMILAGSFRDRNRKLLVMWTDPDEIEDGIHMVSQEPPSCPIV